MWYTSQECAFYIFAHTNSDQAKQKYDTPFTNPTKQAGG